MLEKPESKPNSILTEIRWCTEPRVFSKWVGSVIAYGVNDEGNDWVGEVYFDDGKVYANPEYAIEYPDEYFPMDKIKAVALDLREKVRGKLASGAN